MEVARVVSVVVLALVEEVKAHAPLVRPLDENEKGVGEGAVGDAVAGAVGKDLGVRAERRAPGNHLVKRLLQDVVQVG